MFGSKNKKIQKNLSLIDERIYNNEKQLKILKIQTEEILKYISSVNQKVDKLIASRQNDEGCNSQSKKDAENTDLNNKIFSLEEYNNLGPDRIKSMQMFFYSMKPIPATEIKSILESFNERTRLYVLANIMQRGSEIEKKRGSEIEKK